MKKTVFGSISAGIMIAIGGSAFLACDSKYVGAVLFSVALLCICYLGYYLFTGKIGYAVDDHSGKNICALSEGLLGLWAFAEILSFQLFFCIKYFSDCFPYLFDFLVDLCDFGKLLFDLVFYIYNAIYFRWHTIITPLIITIIFGSYYYNKMYIKLLLNIPFTFKPIYATLKSP